MNLLQTPIKENCGVGGWATCVDCGGRLHRNNCQAKTAQDCKWYTKQGCKAKGAK